MNTRPLPASVLLVLAVALTGPVVPLWSASAPSQTDTTSKKALLMGQALLARDAGNVAEVQKVNAQLEALYPDDAKLKTFRVQTEAQAVAQQTALAERAAAQQALLAAPPPAAPTPMARPAAASTSAPTMIDVRIPEPGQTPPPTTPGTPSAAEVEADAIARGESARINSLVATAQTQLATARAQLRAGQPEDAIATVDAALGSLPANPLTQKLVADLKKEKASALLEQAQVALKRGDAAAARTAMAAHAQLASSSSRTESIDRQIARAEARPVVAAVDPGFVADRAATSQLIAKGRAQYVAGDLDGAQTTFRAIEAQDPDNTVAKGFLQRIAEEKTETGALNREKPAHSCSRKWRRAGNGRGFFRSGSANRRPSKRRRRFCRS